MSVPAAESTTDPTADVKSRIRRLAAAPIPFDASPISPAEALEKLFLSRTDSLKRKDYLKILGTEDDFTNSCGRKVEVSNMHHNLAIKYQENGRGNETIKDVLDGLLKYEGDKRNKNFLAYLFARGMGGLNILHVILDPTTYEDTNFILDLVKPLIRFLLHIYPNLPAVTPIDRKGQPPIYMAFQTYEHEFSGTRRKRNIQRTRFEPSVKQGIIRFLCETQDDGLGSKVAIESLAHMASNTTGSCNAIHKIIESADFDISEAVLRELNQIMISDEHGRTKTHCLEMRDSQGRTCLHIALTAPFNERKMWWAKKLAELRPDLLKAAYVSITKKGLTPLQYLMEQKVKMAEMFNDGANQELFYLLEKLEIFLKHQCLTNFDNHTCRSIMYDKDNAKEIFLTLEDEIVSWEFLESQQLHYKLDTCLRRVHIFNSVSIYWDDASSNAYEIARDWNCAGSVDMFMIFHWLKTRVQVREILEVIVGEGASQEKTTGDILEIAKRSHSDQAIIECLKGLAIESLDWQQMDIPAEVIIKGAGANVRRLYLYCSGLQAVLQSWADTKGLSRLHNLEYVFVVMYQGLESIERVKAYVEKFKWDLEDTFNAMNPQKQSLIVEYKIVPRTKSSDPEAKSQNYHDFEEQDWLRCMDEFADVMEVIEQRSSFLRSVSKSLAQKSPQSPHPIRVALIDDGVKTSYAGLDSNIGLGKSDWQQYDYSAREHFRSYNSSHTGHGTVMAYYIKRVCPRVSLYVAKLDCIRLQVGTGSSLANITFSPDSVAQAIEWAVEQEVDIISMSWAIECRNDNPSYKRLRGAIYAAIKKKIILFCANPDRGIDLQVDDTYPYAVDKNQIICVGAVTQDGYSCSYRLPGVELGIPIKTTVRRNPDGPPQEWRKHSGTSISCALAAGLAAMILHCSLVSGVAEFDSPRWKWLRSHEGMHKAFRTIQMDRSTSGWLPVRRFFEPVLRDLGSPREVKMKAIRSLMEEIFRRVPSLAA